ncbi:MAG: PAS domain-containing protein [Bacteroidetes bacterium]|nr:PAS domain-containing protein [Bacteroidota bacterium]
MLAKLFKNNERYHQSIPADDLIARQRYRLFRTTTVTAGTVIFYAFFQATFIVEVGNFTGILIGLLDLVLVANFFLLPVHRNHKLAYYVITLAAFTTLHMISYYSGGIRASAIMYMAGTMLLGYMLLGNIAGRIVFGLIAVHIILFWYLTENTSYISNVLIGDSSEMINFDYLTTFFLAMLILSAQMNYLESGKNVVIERITEQRNELREKNKELHKLSIVASKADNAIVITDNKGVAEWVNDGFVRLTGYSFEEVVGRKPRELLHGKGTDPETLNRMLDAIDKHLPFSGELLKFRKDKSPFWTQITMTPIVSDDGNEERFIFIESDITPRKLAEEKMNQYMKNLEKTNSELDKFAYVVSHDLKAPLRAIGNLTGWIEEDMADRLPEDIRGHFNTIKGRVVRMEGLINGILDYTKAAKKGGELLSFAAEEVVKDAIELIGAPEKAIINVREGMPVMKAERVKLQQVFLNLIHNAVKYNDKEDIQVDIGFEDQGKDWKFFVKDNGPGIEARYHEKIFVIFQTLNARDEVESRGVGLAIVKKIIEEEGGKIWVESEKGAGATFIFTWPKVKKVSVEESLFSEAEVV